DPDSGSKGNLILGRALREAAVPVDPGAEGRGLEVVLAAYAERRARPRRRPLPRVALACAMAALLAALLLSPAGASVRNWVGDVFATAPTPTRPGLTGFPGGGQLLVQTAAGPWVVGADGSRHRLGDYDEASWSPRGLYVAAAAGRRLSAVAPDGTVHWTLTAPATVREPRWSPSGFLVAFRSGGGLRVLAGDGSEDRPLDESVAPLAPSWSPLEKPQLAYVDAGGALRVVDAERDRSLARAAALPGIEWLEWGSRGKVLLEASPRRLRTRPVAAAPGGHLSLGRPRAFHLPAGERVRDAALAPGGRKVAVLLASTVAGAPRSELVLYDLRHRPPVRLLAIRGRLRELAWAPSGGRLLVAWPRFDEWLFLPTRPVEGKAVSGIAEAFAPTAGAFPRVEGWCCSVAPPDRGHG
ncbi:MAG TPA: hypothetical protein VGG40_10530, partial [Solirubrobacterales bacterium]